MYAEDVPKLWNETIEAHRASVRDATLDAAAALVAEHGLSAVTMSAIAKETGIGRATLYKYFPDVETIMTAWHERQIATHLHHLVEIGDRAAAGGDRLEAVLTAYAMMTHQHHDGGEMATLLHQGAHVTEAERHLLGFVETLIAEGVANGTVRDDVAPAELAAYCLHALGAVGSLPSKAAAHRLVTVTLAGLKPQNAS